MIIFKNKLDVAVTTILKISSKTFKTYHMKETCYRLCLNFWETEIETLATLLFWQMHISMNVCQFASNVHLQWKLFKIDKAFAK